MENKNKNETDERPHTVDPKGETVKALLYFVVSFVIGTVAGQFLFGDAARMLSPLPAEAVTWSQGAVQQVTPFLFLDTEKVVSLITAALLFASAYVIWNKFKAIQYFSDSKSHWRTL